MTICTVTDNNSRKRRLTKIMALSYFSKIILILFLIFSFEQFFYSKQKAQAPVALFLPLVTLA